MATFYDNLRTVSELPTRGDMQKARRTRKIAHGSMDTSNNQQDDQVDSPSDKDYIVQNTFRMDRDGTNYGVGRDGKTYSYTVNFNDKVSEPKLLSAEEQRNMISNITDGKVEIDPDVTDQESLTDIIRSINRMYENGGNLVPDKVKISDMYPGKYVAFGSPQGRAVNFGDGVSTDDVVEINGLGFPRFRKSQEEEDYEEGFASSGKYPGEHVPTHELSHTADYAASRIIDKWIYEKQQEAEKNKNKYPVGELFKKAINNFFGKDYELDESKSVGSQLLREVYDKYDEWEREDKRNHLKNYTRDFFDIAAKNSGFDSVNDAAASISSYAGRTYPHDFTMYGKNYHYDNVDEKEVFAEAYTDVLINGDDATNFSKELIKLWSDYADRWSDRTGATKKKREQEFKQMFDALPNFKTDSKKNNSNPFIQNYRSAPWKYKK